ncbi:universal stress protein [Singulisphaera rosea]
MIEIRKILAPTDFTAHSAKAVRYACGLAERLGAELHLLHILSDIVPAGPDPMLTPILPPEFYTESETNAREALAKVVDPSWGQPAKIVTSTRWGNPVEEMVQEAVDKSVDLIVIVTHGRTGLSHALLGSSAEHIIREAPCPVLTIRDHDHS